eukprot:g13210.t1
MPDKFKVYIETPYGIEDIEGKVCMLHKSLYGTKNAGMLWNKDWTKSMIKLGFRQSAYDPCLFIKQYESGKVCYAVGWVDDVILSTNLSKGNQTKIIDEIKKLGFVLSSVEQLKFYLGIDIKFDRKNKTVKLSQKSYIESLIGRFDLGGAKTKKSPGNPADLPCKSDLPDLETKEGKATWEVLKKFPYRELIGTLAHLSRWTRPDIKFCVGYAARYQILYSQKHINLLKRIVYYLKETIAEGIVFGNSTTPLCVFCDADYGMDKDTRKSTTGIVCLFYGGPGYARSKLQPVLADSTTVSELIAVTHAGKEARWLSWLIADFGVTPNYDRYSGYALEFDQDQKDPVTIYEDNNAVVALSKHRMVNTKVKHIAIRYFMIQELVREQTVVVIRCPTDKNLADIMTKALGPKKHLDMAKYFFTGSNPMDIEYNDMRGY